jgi:putative toxin-antitoxin system antitoxin component (TIGR02293 family)
MTAQATRANDPSETAPTDELLLPSYLPKRDASAMQRAEVIRDGLPAEAFDWLKAELDLTTTDLADVVHIPRRTVSRRKKEGRFKSGESERVLRLIRLYQRAVQVLGGREEARKWMQEDNYALGAETPLDFADTEPGARWVERLLGQIDHGIVT